MINVVSEVGRLRSVVIHPPGPAMERMLPEHIDPASPSYLLFDDLVDVRAAADEHEQLCNVLASVAEVVPFQRLLADTLEDTARKRSLLDDIAVHEGLTDHQAGQLAGLDSTALAASLVAGTVGSGGGEPLFAPAPNLIFTRDLAAVVGDTIVVGNANKTRRRETMLAWSVFEGHARFAEADREELDPFTRPEARPLTIEGGDVLVISDQIACIGASERDQLGDDHPPGDRAAHQWPGTSCGRDAEAAQLHAPRHGLHAHRPCHGRCLPAAA